MNAEGLLEARVEEEVLEEGHVLLVVHRLQPTLDVLEGGEKVLNTWNSQTGQRFRLD